nr:MAG TPA: hypothetical protein [Caudoviricetes sp.]
MKQCSLKRTAYIMVKHSHTKTSSITSLQKRKKIS